MKKSEETKGFILNKARDVFCNKGYVSVTMKDICEATGLSRGGLYRHYSSTKDIFLDQLELHKNNSEKMLDNAFRSNVPAALLVENFFNMQVQEISQTEDQIAFAVYEFSKHENDNCGLFKERFNEATRILAKLLNYAVDKEDIKISNIIETSKHIIHTLEGLKISQSIIKLSKKEIENQINYLRTITGLKF